MSEQAKIMPGISLITPTQIGRIENISLLVEMLLEQTYIHLVKEWIISTVSKDMKPHIEALYSKLSQGWEKLIFTDEVRATHDLKVPLIRLIECEEGSKIGRLRNKANNAATEDIIICLDDDDYYPPERLEHAYESLVNSDKLIAGCSPTFIYDFVFEKQYQFISLGQNHTINCAAAFKKEYLKTNSHDETAPNAEEFSFTKFWTIPMIQLDPLKTINVSSHMQNTYNKRQLLIAFHHGRFNQFETVPVCMIPKKWHDRMREIFLGPPTNSTGIYESPYDIVFFCGDSTKWSPEDESLGGSEQAVKHLAIEWAKAGKKVAVYTATETKEGLPDGVYSTLRNSMNYKNVSFINWMNFPYHHTFKNLILWRSAGIAYSFFVRIRTQRLFLDLHDNARVVPIIDLYRILITTNRQIDRVMFKSNFHRLEFEAMCTAAKVPLFTNEIIPNGLRVDEFKAFAGQQREPFRFCYTSCYTRGLEHTLKYIWPQIVKAEPRAELHVYYGMQLVGDPKFKQTMHELMGSTPNVMNHGRQPLEIVAVEKYKSSFHLYITESPSEIDCIAIRESVLCECIPIISNYGVFAERDGLKIGTKNNAPATSADYEAMGRIIGDLLKKPDDVAKIREQLKVSQLSFDWKNVADLWATLFV